MQKLIFVLLCFFFGFTAFAQYTETINSNRPGGSQGAFAVGRGVLQAEGAAYYGQDKFDQLNRKVRQIGLKYQLRYGLFFEQLEISLQGDYSRIQDSYEINGARVSEHYGNFKANTLGAKYLLYDPYKQHYFDKPNLYSWKDNHRFKLWRLIPAVSVYAGMNFRFGDQPVGYPFFGEERAKLSPKVALITQHNFGPFVFVMNFIGDRLTEEHKTISGIFTLTHSFNTRVSAFVEYQFINDALYSDDLFRLGGAYLLTGDFQLNLSGMVNTKNNPSRWKLGAGVSYRLDRHVKEETLTDPDNPTPIEHEIN